MGFCFFWKMDIHAMNRVLIQEIFLVLLILYSLCMQGRNTFKVLGVFFMAKIACSLLKNKADLCLKIQMKLLLG